MSHSHSAGHDHQGHGHSHSAHNHIPSSSRALVTGLVFTSVFAIVELITGWLSGSLALIGDAGHMVTDSMALGLGALAAKLSQRPATRRHTFGLQRAEIVGALVNAGFMVVVVAWIAYEAVQRLLEPTPVQGVMVLAVAAIGLAVNLVVLKVLHGGEQNLNTRGAILHVMGDLLGSVAALASGAVITLTGWTPIDPLLSLFISALIMISTYQLLRDAIHVVLEGVPQHIDVDDLEATLTSLNGVESVHDLHVWTIASGNHALAAHVRLRAMDQWPEQLDQLRRLLREDFGLEHVTLQPELPYDVAVVPVEKATRGKSAPGQEDE